MSKTARIVALACQKGGVGKTTSAVNLAAAWADQGLAVLLADCDPQASATQALGFDVSGPYEHLGDTLHGLLTNPVVSRFPLVAVAGMDLLPGHIHLAALDNEITLARRGRETLLSLALQRLPWTATAVYDVIVLDCPPALNWLTINALVAATDVLIPVKPDYLSMAGLGDLWDTLTWIRADHNPGLRVAGLLPTMRDRRIAHQTDQFGKLLDFAIAVNVPVLDPIPTSAKAGEAAGAGVPLVRYKEGNGGAAAYRRLAAALWEGWTHATT